MKRLKIKKSPADIVSQSGLALIGHAINRYTMLTQELDTRKSLCARDQALRHDQKLSGPGQRWEKRL